MLPVGQTGNHDIVDIAHDIGAIPLSTAERCSDWVLAYAERKGIVI